MILTSVLAQYVLMFGINWDKIIILDFLFRSVGRRARSLYWLSRAFRLPAFYANAVK